VYGSFWFEREIVKKAVEMLPDNIMFESDFPHMTSLSPGPASAAEAPRASVTKSLEGVSPEIARKVLYENAARLYGVGAHI
jgi:predicted TIM-barrel fold metal-dependent hydrolase